jgi:hypothetical protein
MGSKVFLAVVLAITITRAVGEAQQQQGSHVTEQTTFSIETGIVRPVPLPDKVLQLPRKDEIAVESSVGCTDRGDGLDTLQAAWFVTSEVHLAGQDEIDLVILAANRCLNGANVGPFCVARKTKQGYQLAWGTGGHNLKIMGTRWKGFRDIHRSTITTGKVFITTYRFDGQRSKSSTAPRAPLPRINAQ